jgi:hypothetical protein
VSGSHALPPRWPPQCSCVVIESSFDPGERLQAPVSLWFVIYKDGCELNKMEKNMIIIDVFLSYFCQLPRFQDFKILLNNVQTELPV